MTPTNDPPAPTTYRGPRCAYCGSKRVRRSRAHTSFERFLRAVTPIRFHSCGECQRRGWHWPTGESGRPAPQVTSRPVEERDVRRRIHVRSRQNRRTLVALILGAGFALAIRSCAERKQPHAAVMGDAVDPHRAACLRRDGPAPVMLRGPEGARPWRSFGGAC